MSPLAPTAMIVTVLGLTGFIWWWGIVIAVIGVIVSLIALVKIKGSEGALGGLGLSGFALVTSVVTTAAASVLLAHAYSTECPEGYERHNFPYEIARRKFVFTRAGREIPPEVRPLLNKKIFIKVTCTHTIDPQPA